MMLERMYARASDIQADVVICRSQSFDPALQVYAPMPWSVRQELLPDLMVFSSQDIPSDFFRAFVWWPWDKLLRRQFITSSSASFSGNQDDQRSFLRLRIYAHGEQNFGLK
jgi:hypothetical protein